MTINLTDLKAKAEAATKKVGNDWHSMKTEAHAIIDYEAATEAAAMLPLINALIEWRDAQAEYATQEGLDIGSLDEAWFRLCRAQDALLALIGGQPEQETNNDAS